MGAVDLLAALSDDELAELLTRRPDLADPPPTSFNDLASRASSPYTLRTGLGQLTQLGNQLVDALAFYGRPANVADIAALAVEPPDPAAILEGLDQMRRLGLATPVDHGRWELLPALGRAVIYPFMLGAPLAKAIGRMAVPDITMIADRLGVGRISPKAKLVDAIVEDLTAPHRIDNLLDRGGPDVREFVETVARQGVIVRLRSGNPARGPVPAAISYLLGHGLLVALDWERAELPREVAMAVRGDKPLDCYRPEAPPLEPGPPVHRDGAVSFRPAQVIDLVARIVRAWGVEPPVPLKTGGVGVRDVRAVAKSCDIPERAAARLIEIAGAAELVTIDIVNDRVVPTETFDVWAGFDAAQRWVVLVRAWALATEPISRAGSRDYNDKPVPPLLRDYYPDIEAVRRRAQIVRALRDVSASTPVDERSLLRHVLWECPGRWADGNVDPDDVIADNLDEMLLLGLRRDGALSDEARVALFTDPDPTVAAVALTKAGAFPASITTFTVGADLTALAPGELDPAVRGELERMADVESRGSASMYRFSDRSVRRALDLGLGSSDLLAFLDNHAKPAVPQALRYLIVDVARRHGSLRVGSVSGYVRSDEPALLAEVVRSKKTAKARLRLVAPTVAMSTLPPAKLIPMLRDAGFFPVAEGADGEVRIEKPRELRAKMSRLPRRPQVDERATALWGESTGPDATVVVSPRVRELVTRLRRTSGR